MDDRTYDELIESSDGDRWTLAAMVIQQRATIAALTKALEEIQIGFIGSKEMRQIARAALLAATQAESGPSSK